jgi:hypothetical protein
MHRIVAAICGLLLLGYCATTIRAAGTESRKPCPVSDCDYGRSKVLFAGLPAGLLGLACILVSALVRTRADSTPSSGLRCTKCDLRFADFDAFRTHRELHIRGLERPRDADRDPPLD